MSDIVAILTDKNVCDLALYRQYVAYNLDIALLF
jgi:hypothetical protein